MGDSQYKDARVGDGVLCRRSEERKPVWMGHRVKKRVKYDEAEKII